WPTRKQVRLRSATAPRAEAVAVTSPWSGWPSQRAWSSISFPTRAWPRKPRLCWGGHLMVISDPGWGSLAESGKARVLATLGDMRLKRWPQVPTLKELGHDIVVNSPIGLAGPKDMDPKVVKVLHDAFRKATADPAYNRA